MGVRRFLNLLVANRLGCMYSLRRFDLSRNQFFYTTPAEVSLHGRVLPRIQRESSSHRKHILEHMRPGSSYLAIHPLHRDPYKSQSNIWRARIMRPGCMSSKNPRPSSHSSLKKPSGRVKKQQASEIRLIRLPPALFHTRPAPYPRPKSDELRMDAFALSERSIVFADRQRHVFAYDADADCFVTMPGLHAPKADPLAVPVPRPGGGEGSLYIIERELRPGKSFQFEALVSGQHYNESHPCRTWQCEELPPPPLEEEVFIGFCAVVGDAVCISASGFGTYCFDTVSRSWSRAGDWVLPFDGTAECVPELNLWFGVSDLDYHLPCAADLSPVLAGQRPEPGLVWADNYLPQAWDHCVPTNPAKMVSLGSSRFCIIRCLETWIPGIDTEQVFVDERHALFTGLEVVLAVKGNGKGSINGNRLRMVRHKSRRCRNPESNFIDCML